VKRIVKSWESGFQSATVVAGLVCLALFLASCSDDTSEPAATGTAVITTEPDTLAAPWTLVGPYGFQVTGAGADTLSDLEPGPYTVTWGAYGTWRLPDINPDQQNVNAHGTTVFLGWYRQILPIEDTFATIPGGTFLMGAPAPNPAATAICAPNIPSMKSP
jgi:hypothetical protein